MKNKTRNLYTCHTLQWICISVVVMAICAYPSHAQIDSDLTTPSTVLEFLETNCYMCHNPETNEGGFDLLSLHFSLDDTNTFDRWVQIHDRVRDGEMPPYDGLTTAEIHGFTTDLSKPLIHQQQAATKRDGRSTLRRLNRYEYENTMRDLLDMPWLEIKDMLPEDGVKHRFNKVGDALQVSHVQMARYMDVAEYVIQDVLHSQHQKQKTKRYYTREEKRYINRMKGYPTINLFERVTFPLLGYEAQPAVFIGEASLTVGESNPEIREQESFGYVSGNYLGTERHFSAFKAPSSGKYYLKFKTYSIWVGPQEGEVWEQHLEEYEQLRKRMGRKPVWWKPNIFDVSKGRRSEPLTAYAKTTSGGLRKLQTFDALPDPDIVEFDVYLLRGETVQLDPPRLYKTRPGWKGNPLATKEGMPGAAICWMEVDGPFDQRKSTQAYRQLFGNLPVKTDQNGEFKIITTQPHQDARRLVTSFANQAFRRIPNASEIQHALDVFEKTFEISEDFTTALSAAHTTILCSPGFLYLEERPGPLDSNGLANRLAYFLWNSKPDDELRLYGETGQLLDKHVLADQTERLLSDPKSQRFITSFLDYWLDLRSINDTTPDRTLYPDYYLDAYLNESAVEETQRFFTEMVAENLSASHVIDSDFTLLNEHLANHYGIPIREGVAFQKVKLPIDSKRGGLLTQASVLKITANGTTTSPVLRGVWIMERLGGVKVPPPPPNIPAIEPDIRGAKTIREQLERHRADPSCASCHAKFDPAGFALENYDILGGWRDQYRVTEGDNPVDGVGKNGHLFTFHSGQTVDASAILADGRPFQSVSDFRELLLDDERSIARNLLNQLIVYSTGAPVRFSDRDVVEVMLDQSCEQDYGVRTLIHQIVQSELFRTK